VFENAVWLPLRVFKYAMWLPLWVFEQLALLGRGVRRVQGGPCGCSNGSSLSDQPRCLQPSVKRCIRICHVVWVFEQLASLAC